MLSQIMGYLILPEEISSFERQHLARINRIAIAVLAAHVAFIPFVAAMCGTSVARAVFYTLFVAAGPVLASRVLASPRHLARLVAFSAMAMCGLLIHFGQGPMQIEMHFEIFVVVALLAVYADPLVIVVATLTVAAHHGLVYTLFPRSVFNYDASAWTVLVHAAFVVAESVGAIFVARGFFDNVIGLEKIVGERTFELAQMNLEMALVLGNLEQGFLVVDANGRMAQGRSKILDQWLGASQPDESLWAYVARVDPAVAAWIEVGWLEVFDGFLPPEVSIEQLPKLLVAGERTFSLAYRPVEDGGSKLLVILSDVTAERERERAEAEQAQLQAGFTLLLKDKGTFRDFLQEADELVEAMQSCGDVRSAPARRYLHTLKGNTAAFGLARISEQCHLLEGLLESREDSPLESERRDLVASWARLSTTFREMLGDVVTHLLEVEREEYQTVLTMLEGGAPAVAVQEALSTWVQAPAARRLEQLADHGRAVARRLGKGPVEITVDAAGVRFDTERMRDVSSALVHVIRNAIDHGLESPERRQKAGKDPVGHVALEARKRDGRLILTITDDGAGIDWEKLGQKAFAAGLPWRTTADRVEALFADGVSSRDEATSTSGRGVGLAAVREACETIGGRIEVHSEPGKGTRMVITVPLTAADPLEQSGVRPVRTRPDAALVAQGAALG
jgi:two-component system chemotaxis sensor kinase CheA